MKRMSGSIVDHEKQQKKRTADCTHSNPRSISTFMLDTLTAALLPSPVKWFMDYQEWAEHWWTHAIRSSPVGYVQPIDLVLRIFTTQSILHWVLVFSGCPIWPVLSKQCASILHKHDPHSQLNWCSIQIFFLNLPACCTLNIINIINHPYFREILLTVPILRLVTGMVALGYHVGWFRLISGMACRAVTCDFLRLCDLSNSTSFQVTNICRFPLSFGSNLFTPVFKSTKLALLDLSPGQHGTCSLRFLTCDSRDRLEEPPGFFWQFLAFQGNMFSDLAWNGVWRSEEDEGKHQDTWNADNQSNMGLQPQGRGYPEDEGVGFMAYGTSLK